MVAAVADGLRLLDAFYAMGLGVLAAVLYTLLRAALGCNRGALFVTDVTGVVAAALLLGSFVATFSYTGVARWYMALPMAAGYLCTVHMLLPPVEALAAWVRRTLAAPFRLVLRQILHPLVRWAQRRVAALVATRKKLQKKLAKTLHKKPRVLYNSNDTEL